MVRDRISAIGLGDVSTFLGPRALMWKLLQPILRMPKEEIPRSFESEMGVLSVRDKDEFCLDQM